MREHKCFGLLGERLAHSYSKEIHEFFFEIVGISANYQLIERESSEIRDVIEQVRIGNLSGINITIPYKETVLNYIDVISDEVKEIGACNTIVAKDGRIYGYNSDYYGFAQTLERNKIDVTNQKVTLLGAGGAAKAVVAYLLHKQADITVVSNQGSIKLKELKKRFSTIKEKSYQEIEAIEGEVLIQATPVGMYPNGHQCIVSKEVMSHYKVAVDLIYNPFETLFLKQAKELKMKAINGLDMLLDQALLSEKIWNQIEVNEDVRQQLYRHLRGKLQ